MGYLLHLNGLPAKGRSFDLSRMFLSAGRFLGVEIPVASIECMN